MVNIYKPEFSILQQEILRYLFVKAGESFNARGLAKSLERTQAGIAKALPKLERSDLVSIKKDVVSGRWSIEINRNNHKVIQLKRAENLKLIYESGFADMLEKEFAGGTIILFGSYSRGEDTINSDIDIAIVGRKEKNIELSAFEDIFNREINVNFYPSFKDIHKHLKENIFNGIVIAGSIEL